MLGVIIGVATTTLDAAAAVAADGESDRGDKRPLIGFQQPDRPQTNTAVVAAAPSDKIATWFLKKILLLFLKLVSFFCQSSRP